MDDINRFQRFCQSNSINRSQNCKQNRPNKNEVYEMDNSLCLQLTDRTDAKTHRQNLNNLFNMLDEYQEYSDEGIVELKCLPPKLKQKKELPNYIIFLNAFIVMLGVILRIIKKLTKTLMEMLSKISNNCWIQIKRIYLCDNLWNDLNYFKLFVELIKFLLIMIVFIVVVIINEVVERSLTVTNYDKF